MDRHLEETVLSQSFEILSGRIESRAFELGIPLMFMRETKSSGGVPEDAPFVCSASTECNLRPFVVNDVSANPLTQIEDYLLSIGNAFFNLAQYVRSLPGPGLQTGIFLATDPKTKEILFRGESTYDLGDFVHSTPYPCRTYFLHVALEDIPAVLADAPIDLSKAEPYELNDCLVTLEAALQDPERQQFSEDTALARVDAFQVRVAALPRLAKLNEVLKGVGDLVSMAERCGGGLSSEDELNQVSFRFDSFKANFDLRSELPRSVAATIRERAALLCKAADQLGSIDYSPLTNEDRLTPQAFAIVATDNDETRVVDQSYDYGHMSFRAKAYSKQHPLDQVRIVEEDPGHSCRAIALYHEQLNLLSLPVEVRHDELIPEYFVVETDPDGNKTFPFKSPFQNVASIYRRAAIESEGMARPGVTFDVKHRSELRRPARKPELQTSGAR